jgi:GH25 family lysozyme M1 (1,4-beta-N-acetylmuramidase)
VLPVRIDGIDVFQDDNFPPWQQVADQGVWFAIIKARDDANLNFDRDHPGFPVRHEDSRFRKNWTEARDAGLIRGAYHFFRPTLNATRESVENKCRELVQSIEDAGGVSPGDLPPALDAENRGAATLNAAGTNDILNQFAWWLNFIENWWADRTGHRVRPIIYTGNFWREGLVAPMVPDPAHPNPADPLHLHPDPKFRPGLDNPAGPYVTPDGLRVDFGDYPLWMAGYPADPETCVAANPADPNRDDLLNAINLPNPWLNQNRAIWQYSHCGQLEGQGVGRFLDVNVVASIVHQPNAHGLAARLLKSIDTTPLLSLAGVAPAAAAVDLHRVNSLSHEAPDQVFSLLLLGQGFWPDEFEGIVNEALNGLVFGSPWGGGAVSINALTNIAPFNLLKSRPGSDRLACYYHACNAGDRGLLLRLRQAPKAGRAEPDRLRRMSTTPIGAQLQPQLDNLATFLGKLQVTMPDGSKQPASRFWPVSERRTGLRGSLIAVLRKAEKSWDRIVLGTLVPVSHDARSAEMYSLDPTTDDPVPLVAVNVIPGVNWPALLARAIAQNLGAVGDEYELEGDAYDRPLAGQIGPDAPNLATITDDQRKSLIGDPPPPGKPQAVVVSTRAYWLLPNDPPADFVSHDAAAGAARPPNFLPPWTVIDPPYQLGGLRVVEGADGYRHNVLRSDLDCLMRRMPADVADTQANPPALPIQSDVPFCVVCTKRIKNALQGGVDVKIEPRVLLGSQRVEYDRLPWRDPENDQPRARTVLLAAGAANQPLWGCTLDFDPAVGFRFTDLELHHPAFWDAGSAAEVAHVLKSVSITDLSVTFTVGGGAPQTVPLSIASALAAGAPRNPKASPPRLDIARHGDTRGDYQLGARLSLGWEIPDAAGRTRFLVDAVISLALRGPSNDADPARAVTACRLFPQLAMRYRLPAERVAVRGLHGKIVLLADNADPSNLAGTFKGIAGGKLAASLFSESNAAPDDAVLAVNAAPPTVKATSGRKLATLRGKLTNGTRALLPLPHWSWRYDYVQPLVGAKRRLIAVHDGGEAAFANERKQMKAWPSGQAAFQSTIKKLPRQGAYDGLYIHPDRGNDGTHPVVPSPWCADLGLHLFWRRGLAVASAPSSQHDFAGWGPGRIDQGRGAVRGAPLVPPNQRVDVEVAPAAGGATIAVTYEVTTSAARAGRWEVFLEHGLAFALRYAVDDPAGGLSSKQLAWLAAAIGVAAEATIQQRLDADRANPVTFDATVRALMLEVFSHARWFDAAEDGDAGEQAPTGDAALEGL